MPSVSEVVPYLHFDPSLSTTWRRAYLLFLGASSASSIHLLFEDVLILLSSSARLDIRPVTRYTVTMRSQCLK